MDLRELIQRGDATAIREAIAGLPKLKLQGGLKAAIDAGQVEVAKVFLDSGARIDADWIWQAARRGRYTPLQALMTLGVDPQRVTTQLGQGISPFEIAIRQDKYESIRAFLDGGVSPNARTSFGPALHHALRLDGNRKLHFKIISAGSVRADPLKVDPERSVVDLLISRGASIGEVEGIGPIRMAMKDGVETDRVRQLHAIGASEAGVLALRIMRALRMSERTEAERMIDTAPASELHEPLGYAAELGDLELMQKLVDRGAEVNHKLANVFIAVLQKSKLGVERRVEVLKWCLDRGADVNRRDRHGNAPLEHAQASGHPEFLSLLRQRGARLPRRKGFAKARGYERVYSDHESLCCLGEPMAVAQAVAQVLGGVVVPSVFRTEQRINPKVAARAAVIVRFQGHMWSHVLPLFETWDFADDLGVRSGMDTLSFAYGKIAGVHSYALYREGKRVEYYLHGAGEPEFESSLGTKRPQKSAAPATVIDRAFKRLDAWVLDTELADRNGLPDGTLFIDLIGVEPEDVESVHLVAAGEYLPPSA